MTPQYFMILNAGTMLDAHEHDNWIMRYKAHLGLSQMLDACNELYAPYKKIMENGGCVILDNGAHEGIDCDTGQYLTTVGRLRPSIVVLPDLIGRPGRESREASLSFARTIRQKFPKMKMMFAPQGQNELDTLSEYEWAMRNLNPEHYIIGFGQAYLVWENDTRKDEDARAELIKQVLARSMGNKHTFHILGGRWIPKDFSYLWTADNFMGLDSIKPCTCTLESLKYPERPEKKIVRLSRTVAHSDALIGNCYEFAKQYGLAFDPDPSSVSV